MADVIDPIKFGARVRELRTELGWSQTKLGKEAGAGFSQSNVGWIEEGNGKPKKYAIALAEALQTTPEWLLYGTGKRTLGPRPLTVEQLLALYPTLSVEAQLAITQTAKAEAAKSNKKRA